MHWQILGNNCFCLSFLLFFLALIYTGVGTRRYTMNHGYMQVISNLDRPINTAFIILLRLSTEFPPSEHSIASQCEDISYHRTTFASTYRIDIFLPSMIRA